MTMMYAVEVRTSTQANEAASTVGGDCLFVIGFLQQVAALWGGYAVVTNSAARNGQPRTTFPPAALSVGVGVVRQILEPVPISDWRGYAVRIACLRRRPDPRGPHRRSHCGPARHAPFAQRCLPAHRH